MKNLEKTYNPKEFEEEIYKTWKEGGYFKAVVDENKKPFTIMMPPPNVTGNLHIGHALNSTIQDIIIRYKRLRGFNTLWLPGTDHASISTEAKVVNHIKENGSSKEEIGREKFLEQAWNWTHEYGGKIKTQLEKLGVSCDWSRDSFTLDDNLSHAVEEFFIKLYDDGLIYRGDRIVNWCSGCKTAISDIEVEHKELEGTLYYVKYFIKDSDEYITVATTRPETIFGDLALAINPKDKRYEKYLGKEVVVPIVNRNIPIIKDDYVDEEYGSGVVKITPSHENNF